MNASRIDLPVLVVCPAHVFPSSAPVDPGTPPFDVAAPGRGHVERRCSWIDGSRTREDVRGANYEHWKVNTARVHSDDLYASCRRVLSLQRRKRCSRQAGNGRVATPCMVMFSPSRAMPPARMTSPVASM